MWNKEKSKESGRETYPLLLRALREVGSSGRGGWGQWAGDPGWGQGKVGEGYLMSFCPADSPVGPKHREASGQGAHWPQQVDHSPELGAPPCVSDTDNWGE